MVSRDNDGCPSLSPTRYPGENAGKRQAAAALRWVGRVRAAARALLGIRERRPRRRK